MVTDRLFDAFLLLAAHARLEGILKILPELLAGNLVLKEEMLEEDVHLVYVQAWLWRSLIDLNSTEPAMHFGTARRGHVQIFCRDRFSHIATNHLFSAPQDLETPKSKSLPAHVLFRPHFTDIPDGPQDEPPSIGPKAPPAEREFVVEQHRSPK